MVLEEIEDLTKALMGKDYAAYSCALSFYEDSLCDNDFERLPESFYLTYPSWLTFERAKELKKDLADFMLEERRRLPFNQ